MSSNKQPPIPRTIKDHSQILEPKNIEERGSLSQNQQTSIRDKNKISIELNDIGDVIIPEGYEIRFVYDKNTVLKVLDYKQGLKVGTLILNCEVKEFPMPGKGNFQSIGGLMENVRGDQNGREVGTFHFVYNESLVKKNEE